jgi:hypothetical protein
VEVARAKSVEAKFKPPRNTDERRLSLVLFVGGHRRPYFFTRSGGAKARKLLGAGFFG